MQNTIIFCIDGNAELSSHIANEIHCEQGELKIHEFPDAESYIQIVSAVKNKNVIILCSLDHPNSKILPLLFIADNMKQLGAHSINLITPYLAYMRQDKHFKSGDIITSHIFAKLLSSYFNSVFTIDSHLHRIKNLSEIYTIPAFNLHATKPIASWIEKNINQPLLIGPDEESEQWITNIANETAAPYIILKKVRYGDNEVKIDFPKNIEPHHTPVIIDDIISSGASMLNIIKEFNKRNLVNPTCITVHALFSDKTYQDLINAGAKQIISCNTIKHYSNKIDVSSILSESINLYTSGNRI